MREADQILWALDNVISPTEFERLCVDLLGREGYRHIVPIGGTKDQGRDAEIRFWLGKSERRSSVVFQFSLEDKWEAKLKSDAAKIAEQNRQVHALVFVTSRKVTGAKEAALEREFQAQHEWQLTIYSREWLRHRLTETHHDLAASYLGISPQPTPGYAAVQFERCELDDYATAEIFRHTSPELLRATLAGRTKKEPEVVEHWYELARVEFLLRNYEGAIQALERAFNLNPTDDLLVLNMTLFKAVLLAEKGILQHSRPLLVQARDIMMKAMPGRKRAVDHYNLANILGALGEVKEAKRQYTCSLALDASYAQAWKNLGSLLIQEGEFDGGIECFDHALKCRPDLIEAHLSKATALLICLNRPNDAIACFEAASKFASASDVRWPYVGYWYSEALSAVGRHTEALVQVEQELSLKPDDIHLLNRKTAVLMELQGIDPIYEQRALELLKFRSHALPQDFFGLASLIEILEKRGEQDDAWPFIEANLDCKPFSVRAVTEQVGISIKDLALGFRFSRLYGIYRTRCSLEDHCIMLHEYGLCPDSNLLSTLDYALMAPFGVAASELSVMDKNDLKAVEAAAETALNTMCRIFPAFGSAWLAREEPKEKDEKTRYLSLGIFYLADVAVSEVARQIGFLRGCYQLSKDDIFSGREWKETRENVGVRLFDRVVKDWHLGFDEFRSAIN